MLDETKRAELETTLRLIYDDLKIFGSIAVIKQDNWLGIYDIKHEVQVEPVFKSAYVTDTFGVFEYNAGQRSYRSNTFSKCMLYISEPGVRVEIPFENCKIFNTEYVSNRFIVIEAKVTTIVYDAMTGEKVFDEPCKGIYTSRYTEFIPLAIQDTKGKITGFTVDGRHGEIYDLLKPLNPKIGKSGASVNYEVMHNGEKVVLNKYGQRF